MGHLTGLLDKIEPAVDQVSAATKTGEKTAANSGFVDACIEKNVRLQMKSLMDQSPILKDLASNGSIRIVGGMQDLASGRVRFLK